MQCLAPGADHRQRETQIVILTFTEDSKKVSARNSKIDWHGAVAHKSSVGKQSNDVQGCNPISFPNNLDKVVYCVSPLKNLAEEPWSGHVTITVRKVVEYSLSNHKLGSEQTDRGQTEAA